MAAQDKKDLAKELVAKQLSLVPDEKFKSAKLMDKVEILNKYNVLIAQLLPKNSSMDAETIATLCAIVMSENPDVGACEPRSLLSCVIKTAILDLNPMPMFNEVYFIPRKKYMGKDGNGQNIYETHCNFQIGYEGWLKLLWDTGKVKRLSVEPVHVNDFFEDVRGSKPKITHIPKGFTPINREDLHCVYVIVEIEGMNIPISMILYKDRIEHLRMMGLSDFDKDKDKLTKAWEKSYIAMAMAKAIHQIAKLLPLSRNVKEVTRSKEMAENSREIEIVEHPKEEPKNISVIEVKDPDPFDYLYLDLETPDKEALSIFYAKIEKFEIAIWDLSPEWIVKFSIAIESGKIDILPIPQSLIQNYKPIENAVLTIENA